MRDNSGSFALSMIGKAVIGTIPNTVVWNGSNASDKEHGGGMRPDGSIALSLHPASAILLPLLCPGLPFVTIGRAERFLRFFGRALCVHHGFPIAAMVRCVIHRLSAMAGCTIH